jgi:hypothetical protein
VLTTFLASQYVPVVSCAAVAPIVGDILTAVDFPAVDSVSDVAADNTADDAHSASGVASFSAVPTAVDALSVTNISGIFAVVGVP